MDGWRGGDIQLLFAFIVWLEQHMVSLIICKYLDIHSGWAVRKTAGIPWRHSSITFSYLNRSTEVFLHAPSQADISGDWPTNWQDVRGHTLSTQTHCRSAFGKWRLAACVGRKQRQTEGQGPVLSSPSGIQRSFVSRLNQILTTEELIKTASCATEPLCCDLASVTLACLKVPDLEAKSCFPAAACGSSGQLLSSSPGPRWLLPSTLTLQMEFGVCVMCADFILFTYLFFTIMFMLETDFASLQEPLSCDNDRAANRAQSRPPVFLNRILWSSHAHRRFGTSHGPNILRRHTRDTQKQSKRKKFFLKKGDLLAVLVQLYWCSFLHLFDV